MSRQGPMLTVVGSCRGCEFERSEYYCIEDGNDCDSGYNRSCVHPNATPPGATDGTPPTWCPFLPASLAALAASIISPSGAT